MLVVYGLTPELGLRRGQGLGRVRTHAGLACLRDVVSMQLFKVHREPVLRSRSQRAPLGVMSWGFCAGIAAARVEGTAYIIDWCFRHLAVRKENAFPHYKINAFENAGNAEKYKKEHTNLP